MADEIHHYRGMFHEIDFQKGPVGKVGINATLMRNALRDSQGVEGTDKPHHSGPKDD